LKRANGSLKRLLSHLGLEEPMLGWQAVSQWHEITGEKVASHTQAIRFQQGILVVEVDNPSWMNELSYMKHQLVEEINKKLDRPVVKTIIFRPRVALGKKEETS